MFLTDDDLVTLTGRKARALQVRALREMGIPFMVNAAGKPVVTRAALEGKPKSDNDGVWRPKVLTKAA